jgi:ribonuclease III
VGSLPKLQSFNTPTVNAERKKELLLFERNAKVRFKRLDLLNLAFTHRSYANENPGVVDNNEKLEFLGDSVLGIVISDYLFRSLPDKNEGDLARIKSFVVSETSLAEIARALRVDNFILIGKGEEHSGGRKKKAILADCMEAIIGAYYLDSGIKCARNFILSFFVEEINKVLENKHQKDYKTLLQEFAQKKYHSYPRYRLVKKSGPDHDRTFWIEVELNNRNFGPGKGKNKKQAEQEAASIAYEYLCEANQDSLDLSSL